MQTKVKLKGRNHNIRGVTAASITFSYGCTSSDIICDQKAESSQYEITDHRLHVTKTIPPTVQIGFTSTVNPVLSSPPHELSSPSPISAKESDKVPAPSHSCF